MKKKNGEEKVLNLVCVLLKRINEWDKLFIFKFSLCFTNSGSKSNAGILYISVSHRDVRACLEMLCRPK